MAAGLVILLLTAGAVQNGGPSATNMLRVTSMLDRRAIGTAANAAFSNFLHTFDRDGSNSVYKVEMQNALTDLGWEGDIDSLWTDLVKQCKSAATGVPYDEVDAMSCTEIVQDEVLALYSSPAYHTELYASRAAEEIIGLLKTLFDAADTDRSGAISGEELRAMSAILSERFNLEADPAFLSSVLVDTLDRNKDKQISYSEFAAGVLSLDVPDDDAATFEHSLLLEPAKYSADEFVNALKDIALAHPASKHPFLEDIARGRFPSFTKVMLTYATEYSVYSSSFIKLLQACSEKFGDGPGADVLKENLEEEMGNNKLGEAELEVLGKLEIPSNSVEGIAHKQIFADFVEAIRRHVEDGQPYGTARSGSTPGQTFLNDIQSLIDDCPAHVGLAVLAYSAELLVEPMYENLLEGLAHYTNLTAVETRFFPLHISCDGGHFHKLASVVEAHAKTTAQRTEIYEAVVKALEARATMWDELNEMCRGGTESKEVEATSSLYNKQAANWVRDTPNCLSDFTGRPRLFEACGDVTDKHMLDVGCGEGYCARVLRKAGVRKVVGVDVSEQMVKAAEHAERTDKLGNMYYLTADALDIKQALCDNAPAVGMLGGAEIERGCFDLAIAAFLFNYVETKPMERIMEQVYDMLVPGGAFVFSVPHPMMAGKSTGQKMAGGAKFGFTSDEYTGYFSARDVAIPGEISTRDGKSLKVRMIHKTFEDYMGALTRTGFVLEELKECSVTEEHLKLDPTFFGPVSDLPLHVVFRCIRPSSTTHSSRNLNNLAMLPRQLMWTPIELNNPEDAFTMHCPPSVAEELYSTSIRLVQEQGLKVDDFKPEMLLPFDLSSTAKFGVQMRRQLTRHTGAVIIKTVDLNRLGGKDHPLLEETAKMLYYLLCRSIGTVEEGSRGRLFDVKNSGLSHEADNVLFSVTDGDAPWHTDGTSRDKVFDVTGLMCLQPAEMGGEFSIANACNAYASLVARMPRFLLFELMRPLPRELVEKGKGKGSAPEDCVGHIARSEEMLQLRLLRNSFPIFELAGDETAVLQIDRRMRFRYMRFWVESGHQKAGFRVSPMLRMAMDFLDKELDQFCCFKAPLEAGYIVFSNNHLIAHAREAYTDGAKQRHMVRAWIQVAVADAIDEIDESEGNGEAALAASANRGSRL